MNKNHQKYQRHIELLFHIWRTVTPNLHHPVDLQTAVYNWSVNWNEHDNASFAPVIHELFNYNFIHDWPGLYPEKYPLGPYAHLLEKFNNNPRLAGERVLGIKYYITPEGDTAIKRELAQGELAACLLLNGSVVDWRQARAAQRDEDKWHEGELVYSGTSGSLIKLSDDRFVEAREYDPLWPKPEKPESRVLIVTATDIETRAILRAFKNYRMEYPGNITVYDFGDVGGVHLYLLQSGVGTTGPNAAAATISEAVAHLHPNSIIMAGIAFGVDPKDQEIGQILISEQLHAYGPKRVNTTPEGDRLDYQRGDTVTASPRLISRFKDGAIHWTESRYEFGLLLSGDELVDNLDRRSELIRYQPEAIGGEMEGAGLYSIAARAKVDWIIVKAICDWADGNKRKNKEENQRLAARNAARFVSHVINRGGLAHQPTQFMTTSDLTQVGFTDWVDISDQIVNPGFEDGFRGWEEDPSVINSEHAASQSRDDPTEANSGSHSRKLFLREGGSYIKQTIELTSPLPVGCQIKLSAHIKMPFRGSLTNKTLSLLIVAHGGRPGQEDPFSVELEGVFEQWEKFSFQTKELDYPVHKLEIHAFTTRGNGLYKGFEKPVWVDDFTLEYRNKLIGPRANLGRPQNKNWSDFANIETNEPLRNAKLKKPLSLEADIKLELIPAEYDYGFRVSYGTRESFKNVKNSKLGFKENGMPDYATLCERIKIRNIGLESGELEHDLKIEDLPPLFSKEKDHRHIHFYPPFNIEGRKSYPPIEFYLDILFTEDNPQKFAKEIKALVEKKKSYKIVMEYRTEAVSGLSRHSSLIFEGNFEGFHRAIIKHWEDYGFDELAQIARLG